MQYTDLGGRMMKLFDTMLDTDLKIKLKKKKRPDKTCLPVE